MTLQPLSHTLHRIERDPRWANYRSLQMLQQIWTEAVGATVAQHTAPISLQRGILKVATSTGSWAQNLGFQKHLIVSKLNPHLATPLADIRFLPGEWYRRHLADQPGSSSVAYLGQALFLGAQTHRPQSPQDALERWHQRILEQHRQMPRCPQCGQVTTPQELTRWRRCGYCWIQSLNPAADRGYSL